MPGAVAAQRGGKEAETGNKPEWLVSVPNSHPGRTPLSPAETPSPGAAGFLPQWSWALKT